MKCFIKTYIMIMMVALIAMVLTKACMGANDGVAESKTVAGIDCQKAVEALYRADMAVKEEQRQQDIEMLAHLINAENEGYTARLYTGSVVLNRVKSDRYPDSIEGVIWQRGQYACLNDGHYWWNPDEEAYEIAEQLVDGGSVLPAGVLYAAEFIQGKIYDKIDGTYYCYGS